MPNVNFSSQTLARKVVLVDENDRVLGEEGLIQAHQGGGLLHRASSVFLFRKNADQIELLFQQRSPQKILAAGQWANTVCGNLKPGETYLECAIRRLEEEVGVKNVPLTELVKYRYQVECDGGFSENEMDMIYAGWYDGPVLPNKDEVAQTQWVEWEKAKNFVDLFKEPFAPWVKLMLLEPTILKPISNFLEGKK